MVHELPEFKTHKQTRWLPLKRCIFPITSNTSKKIHIVWNEKVRFGGYIQSVCCLLPMTLMNRNTDQLSVTPADALLHCISSLKHDFWCEGHPASITVSSLFSIPLQIIFFAFMPLFVWCHAFMNVMSPQLEVSLPRFKLPAYFPQRYFVKRLILLIGLVDALLHHFDFFSKIL